MYMYICYQAVLGIYEVMKVGYIFICKRPVIVIFMTDSNSYTQKYMYSIQILSTYVPFVNEKIKVLVYISHKYIQSLISF